MDLMDVSNEIQESLGRSYNVPDDIDEDDLMGGKIHSVPQVLSNCDQKLEVRIITVHNALL